MTGDNMGRRTPSRFSEAFHVTWLVLALWSIILAILLLTACTMQPVRALDNGASGGETWSVPVPVWPDLPSLGGKGCP